MKHRYDHSKEYRSKIKSRNSIPWLQLVVSMLQKCRRRSLKLLWKQNINSAKRDANSLLFLLKTENQRTNRGDCGGLVRIFSIRISTHLRQIWLEDIWPPYLRWANQTQITRHEKNFFDYFLYFLTFFNTLELVHVTKSTDRIY